MHYLVVPRRMSLVLTMRFSAWSIGMVPSTWPMRMLAASSPTRMPCCSTVVSIGSHDVAHTPLVNPQMLTSSGTRMPMRFTE